MFCHLSPWTTPEICVETLRRGIAFARQSIWGVTCLHLLEKWTCFPIYLLGNCINVCWNPQNRACFSKMIDLRGHMPRFTLKMNIMLSISLGNCINECWNPQNRACFSKMIDLKGHMPRFTLKINVLLSISLETPKLCVETLRRGFIFLDNQFEGSHAYVYSDKWMFSHLSPWQLHKCVLKSSEQDSFFQDDWFEGSHA